MDKKTTQANKFVVKNWWLGKIEAKSAQHKKLTRFPGFANN
ncbi:hypothetical protein [Nostoc sp.]